MIKISAILAFTHGHNLDMDNLKNFTMQMCVNNREYKSVIKIQVFFKTDCALATKFSDVSEVLRLKARKLILELKLDNIVNFLDLDFDPQGSCIMNPISKAVFSKSFPTDL